MFTSLSGRSVLVTGGSKGIGKGIAAGFAAEGGRVVISGRDQEAGERAARELTDTARAAGGEVAFVAGDVADQESCQAVAAAAQQRHGGLDVVCCNAGIFPLARLDDMTARQLDEMLAINLKGTFFTIQAALPALRRSAHGRIIVISSITGPVTGFSGWSHYGASKAGQLGLVRTAALELAPAGITVNAILPGNIATEDEDPDYIRSMEAAIPQRHLGSVQDIASAALFFATDEAGYITGQTLIVDGGQTLPESADAMS
ncbi:MAG TPA: 3-oxoacyl-ACP reductase FabG [Streptosporangiaceae bacterium]